jgi:dipeptidyl aminopeptidase/acylaminoacyl peptidase
MRKGTLLFLLPAMTLAVLTGTTGWSQSKKDSITIEKALTRYGVSGLLFSPDGTKAVAVISQPAMDGRAAASHLWMVDVGAKSIRQFTNSTQSENTPRWSPDGKQLAFLSARDGENQLYLMDLGGGEALPLTQSKTSVNGFEWNPGGKTIAYLTEDEQTDAEKKRIADKFDERVISESRKPTRIVLVDVATKQTTALMKMSRDIQEMRWMPSGDALLLMTEVLPAGEIPKQELVRFSIADSMVLTLPAPAHSAWGNVVIAPDGKNFAYVSAREDGPVPHDLFLGSFEPAPTQKDGSGVRAVAKNLTAQNMDLPVGSAKFITDHSLLVSVHKGLASQLWSVTDKGACAPYGVNRNVQAFDVSAKGDVIFESFDATHLSEVWWVGSDKMPVQVSHFNKAFDSLALVAPTFVKYKSFDGTMIESALYKPVGSGTKLLPLVVYIHGGPTSAFLDSYSAWAQLFVQKGYAVFCPNIRGSSGYGWKFLAANRNDWGGGDFKDIMAGVDMLIAKEGIDPDRMGISGWSYGGFMAEWAITQTNRFKASMSGAGLSNLATEFGTEDGPVYDQWFFGTPYEHPDNFIKHSPITFIKNAKTPTLIIQGENDQTDPISQSQELYRGLRYYDVPTELVVYPREPHGFREMKHTIDFYTRMLAWFDKYVK